MKRLLLPVGLVLFPLLAASSALGAYDLTTDYSLRLPGALVDRLAGSAAPRKGEEKVAIGDSSFELAGAKIELSGAGAHVAWELAAPVSLGERSWKVSTSRLGAAFTVAVLRVRTSELRERDGVVIDHDSLVECRNVTLRLKPEAGARVEGDVTAELENGKLKFTLANYKGHWPASAWAMETLDCPGVAGIGTVVAQRILSAMADVSLVDSQVRPALEKALLAAGESASAGLLGELSFPSGIDGLTLTAEGGEVREIEGGFEMRGKLKFRFAKATNHTNVEARFETFPAGSVGANAQLVLPEAALNALLEAGFHSSLLKHDLQAKDLGGFEKLSGSRLRQFFAWPDLRRFPKNTNYLFRFAPVAAPALRNARSAGNALQGQLGFPLSIRMFAPIERRWFPYVEFRTRLDAGASFRLQGGALKVKLRAHEGGLTHAFSREYVDRFRPNTRISTRRLAPALFSALNENELTIRLPSLNVAGAKLTPAAWALERYGREKALRLEFQPK